MEEAKEEEELREEIILNGFIRWKRKSTIFHPLALPLSQHTQLSKQLLVVDTPAARDLIIGQQRLMTDCGLVEIKGLTNSSVVKYLNALQSKIQTTALIPGGSFCITFT